LDGRLDLAERELLLSTQDGQLGRTMAPYQGLAAVFLDRGQFDKAAPVLQTLENQFNDPARLRPDDKAIAEQFLSSPARVSLELLRCDLAMGKLRHALARADKLWDSPQAAACSAYLVAYHASRSRLERECGRPAQADAALETAHAIVVAARKAHPADVCLAWQEALLVLQTPNSSLALADGVLSSFLASLDKLSGTLLWARWLATTDRPELALEVLATQTALTPHGRRAVQSVQVSATLRARTNKDARHLINALTCGAPHSCSAFSALLLCGRESAADESPSSMQPALGSAESPGLRFLQQGESSQGNGKYRQAMSAYERAMQYYHVRTSAREHLIECLMGIADTESCNAAFQESMRLDAQFPDDPWLLLAHADLARRLDRITPENGMAPTLARLKGIVLGASVHPVQRVYLASFLWNDASRPDIARAELREALRADPTHRPALVLATRLALENEDWGDALSYAAAAEKLQPGDVEARMSHARALVGLGKVGEARSMYLDLNQDFPKQPHGHRGLAELLETAKDYRAAYEQAKLWHACAPDDADAMRTSIRVLIHAGQAELAGQIAVHLLEEGTRALRHRIAAVENASEFHQGKNLSPMQTQSMQRETQLMGAIVLGFKDAGDFTQAAAWAKQLVSAAEKATPTSGEPALFKAHLLLGEVYGAEALHSEHRKELVGQALEHLHKAYALSPGNQQAGIPLALLLSQERGENEAACRVVDEMRNGRISREPISGDRLDLGFLDALARVYHAANREEEAVKVLIEAQKRYEREPLLALHLGRCNAALKKKEEARMCFSQAILQAEERAAKANYPDRKAAFQRLAEEARVEQRKLTGGRPNPRQILKT
jgi:tetratricopeptide (TPR) repeat protein